MYHGIYMELSNSEELKKSYLETEDKHSEDLNKIKEMLSIVNPKDTKQIDLLLDSFNYANASYNVLKLQYLTLYITQYLYEKKIIQDSNIPINTSLKMLLNIDWITNDTKAFLKKHFVKALKDQIDYSNYVISIENYFKYSHIFK